MAWKLRSRGVSLVEMMIALTVGLVLVGGAIQIFTANKQTYNVQEALSRLQENARFAIELISQDVRMAGYAGCGGSNVPIANSVSLVVAAAGGGEWMNDSSAITGFNGGGPSETANAFPSEYSGAAITYGDPVPDPDSILMRRSDSDNPFQVISHDKDTQDITLARPHDIKQGEIVMITDPNCTQAGIFQATAVGSTTINHNATASTSTPGNCTNTIYPSPNGGALTCPASPAAKAYPNESTLMRFFAHAYYIGTSTSGGVPSLFREVLTHEAGNAKTEAEELVQGVENMQILYGYDSDCILATDPGCGVANQYLRADQVPAGEWNTKVVSVRIFLLLRSLTEVASAAQAYSYAGSTFTPVDRYLRREYSTTIQLRNRGAI
jgi:type IV pilus assembly protein PilW